MEKTELGVSKEDYVKGVMYLFESFELLFELLGEIVLTMFLGIFERIVNYIYIYMLEIWKYLSEKKHLNVKYMK